MNTISLLLHPQHYGSLEPLMILAVTIKRLFWVSSDKDFPFPSTADGSAAAEAPRSAQGVRAGLLAAEPASSRASAAAAFTVGKLLTPENCSPNYSIGAWSKPHK